MLNRFIWLTSVKGIKRTNFHWLLKIVARLRRELGSLNENFTAFFFCYCFAFSPGTYPQSKIKIVKILLRHWDEKRSKERNLVIVEPALIRIEVVFCQRGRFGGTQSTTQWIRSQNEETFKWQRIYWKKSLQILLPPAFGFQLCSAGRFSSKVYVGRWTSRSCIGNNEFWSGIVNARAKADFWKTYFHGSPPQEQEFCRGINGL